MAPLPFEESLDDVLDAWGREGLAAAHSDRTIGSRRYTIRRLAASGVDPLIASRDDLTDWLSTLTNQAGEPATRGSRATYRSQLRAFYIWLVDTGRREDDPSVKLPKPKPPRGQPRPLSEADVRRAFAACADPRAARTRAYLTLACYAGLRIHEIAKVRGEDIFGSDLRVRGKGGSDAMVPLHPEIAVLATRMPASGWWFPAPTGPGHVHRGSVGAAITRALRRAGVNGTPHACRHFYGTQVLASSGGNLRTTQRAMRHADIRSTAIYTQVVDDALRRAIGGIPAA